MVEGLRPTRRRLLAVAGTASTAGLAGCGDVLASCDPRPAEVAPDAWTHRDANAAGTGSVEGAVTRLDVRHLAESDGGFGPPVVDESGIYAGTGSGVYVFDHDGTERWVTGGQLGALSSPPTRVLRRVRPVVVTDGHVVANVEFRSTAALRSVMAGLYAIRADGDRAWAIESWAGTPLVGDDGLVYLLEHSSASLRERSPDSDRSQDRARVRAFDLRSGDRCWSHDRSLLGILETDPLFDATEPLAGVLRDEVLVVVVPGARTIRLLDRTTGDVVGEQDVQFDFLTPPAAVGETLFTATRRSPPGDYPHRGDGSGAGVVAYDTAREEVRWRYRPWQQDESRLRRSRPSPYAVGSGVLVWTAQRETVALDVDDGAPLWSTDPTFVEPAIVGDAVLLVEEGGEALVCRDVRSGEERHRSEPPFGTFRGVSASRGRAYVKASSESRNAIVVYDL